MNPEDVIGNLKESGLSDETLDEVIAFMRSANPFAQRLWGWDTGRFIDFRWGSNNIRADWNDDWFGTHCRIFRSGGDIAAVAIAEDGNEHECIITSDEQPDLVAAVLTRLIEEHRSRGIGISLEFSMDAEWLRAICRQARFKEEGVTGREWEYDLSEVDLTTFVPDGYVATTLREHPDLDRALIAHCVEKAFGSSRDLAPIIRNIERNPMFLPELSAVVLDQEGTVAAYCRGTVDPENGVCGIDPVCTHPDHHRRGLGKAVVRKLMSNQRSLGGRYSYIGSAPPPAPGTFLYESLGPSHVYVSSSWSG